MSQPPAGGRVRPTGITILAVLSAISGVLSILAGLGLLAGGAALAAVVSVGGLFTIFGILAIVIGALSLAFAYGAWMLLPWAWILGIASQLIGIGVTIVQIVLGYQSITGAIIGIAISLIILYYLDTPDVRRAFGRSPESWFGGLTNRKS